MEKTATLNLRVNPQVKEQAEAVLARLGVPMSTAINIYLNQITLTGGIPFAVSLPQAPYSVNADLMSDEALRAKLERGYDDAEEGRVRNAKEALSELLEMG
ncbi:MAG: type II toxin-antitoxin system RelB/DinJ family antitoxin [Peptococcaceae bacterium]|nr:type II toxin-antitoxin system RelB/DinJ family antitoxin [Peptococcaceae bacterium]